jgi:hypothetical protein
LSFGFYEKLRLIRQVHTLFASIFKSGQTATVKRVKMSAKKGTPLVQIEPHRQTATRIRLRLLSLF